MGRKRSRQPSAPPAGRRRRRPWTRTGRSRSEVKETPARAKIGPAAAARRTGPPPSSEPNKETRRRKPRDATGLKRPRSRSREPSAMPARRRRLPSPARRSPPEPKVTVTQLPKIGYLAARRTGRLRGQPLRRPGTPPPPPERRPTFRASPSPEPSPESAEKQRQCRDGGRKQEKALYLIVQEHGNGNGAVVSGYAVHRVDLARSRHGISVSGEVLDDPPVARFKAAPGMSFFKSGSSEKKKIVGVTDKDAGVIEAESVVIDPNTWEVSTGPPPSSTEYGLVEVSGKIFAADMLAEDPSCEVLLLRSVNAGWSPLPRPPFRDRILTLAPYPPRRGVLVSTEKNETYLFDRRRRGRSAWVALPGSATPLPLDFEERAVYAEDHGLWFEVSPADGRLHAHHLDVVTGALPRLEHATLRVSDPIPVITASSSAKLVYLGKGNFCVAQAAAAGERGGAGEKDGGCRVTVTMFRVIDSERMTVTPAERRRERGMNARWVAAELERACADEASTSGRGRRRKLCRVNMWSRTYIVGGGAGHERPCLAGLLWM